MNYRETFQIVPGSHVQLKDFDPHLVDNMETKASALLKITKLQQRMDMLQFQLFAEQKRSLLICLQVPARGARMAWSGMS